MVDSITNTTTNATNRISAGSTMLASDFETFLTLLTSQLKNQDPLSPVDSNQFTAQLTQMAGVEQQLLTNDLLKGLLAAQGGGGLAGAATYIGKEATAAWSATKLTDGEATWSYELASNAASARLEVLDGTGKVVWSGDAPDRTTGVHDFTWDGETTTGANAGDGQVYSLRVVARDAAGGRHRQPGSDPWPDHRRRDVRRRPLSDCRQLHPAALHRDRAGRVPERRDPAARQ